MKNILKYAAVLLLAGSALSGCETETTPERKIVQHPDQQTPLVRDDADYARLRAYKKTKHKVAFGWFGSWNPDNSSRMATLNHAPDSMDIISIWSQWHSLTPAQMKDKEFVQKVKGTKVTYTIFSDKMPEPFATMYAEDPYSDEAIEAYAKAYCKDSMDKYQYDGIDLDYEPGFGASGPFVGHDNENFKRLILAMSQYVGPRSGTGRLFMIDGVPYAVHKEIADCFDYGIVQAYYSSSYTDLQNRFDNAYNKGWKPEQYIFAEDFEKGWQNGGVNHRMRNGQTVPSLFGMAYFNPDQGTGGGFGAYHMEYEYGHNDMVYKFMRQAIQLVNPAPAGDYSKTLVSINEAADMASFSVEQTPSGHLFGEVATEITGKLSTVAAADTDIQLTIDNDFVTAYNAENDTEYRTVDPANVVFSGALHFPAGEQYTESAVRIAVENLSSMESGSYMVVVRPDVTASKTYGVNEKAQRKILVFEKQMTTIKVSVTGNVVDNISVMSLIDGTTAGDVSSTFGVSLSRPAISALDVRYQVDNSLVEAYNEENGTAFTTIDASKVAVSGQLHVDANTTSSTADITASVADLSLFEVGVPTLIALRPVIASTDYDAHATAGVKYMLVVKSTENVAAEQNLDDDPTQTCTAIDNANNKLGWDVTIENLNRSVGGTGVWQFNNTSEMFDGTGYGWYCQWGSYYSWQKGVGGSVTLDMKNSYDVKAFAWNVCYGSSGYGIKTIRSVEVSADGVQWEKQNYNDVAMAQGNPQWITFINPVSTRYIRLTITDGYNSFCGMAEMAVYTPNN